MTAVPKINQDMTEAQLRDALLGNHWNQLNIYQAAGEYMADVIHSESYMAKTESETSEITAKNQKDLTTLAINVKEAIKEAYDEMEKMKSSGMPSWLSWVMLGVGMLLAIATCDPVMIAMMTTMTVLQMPVLSGGQSIQGKFVNAVCGDNEAAKMGLELGLAIGEAALCAGAGCLGGEAEAAAEVAEEAATVAEEAAEAGQAAQAADAAQQAAQAAKEAEEAAQAAEQEAQAAEEAAQAAKTAPDATPDSIAQAEKAAKEAQEIAQDARSAAQDAKKAADAAQEAVKTLSELSDAAPEAAKAAESSTSSESNASSGKPSKTKIFLRNGTSYLGQTLMMNNFWPDFLQACGVDKNTAAWAGVVLGMGVAVGASFSSIETGLTQVIRSKFNEQFLINLTRGLRLTQNGLQVTAGVKTHEIAEERYKLADFMRTTLAETQKAMAMVEGDLELLRGATSSTTATLTDLSKTFSDINQSFHMFADMLEDYKK